MPWLPFRKAKPKDPLAGLITVLWSQEGISLAGWAPRMGNGLLLQGTGSLEAARCDVTGYREQLAHLRASLGRKAFSVQWICFEEGLASMEGNGLPPGLSGFPDWMLACWRELEAKELPERLVSATACLEAELRKWPEFREPGTGVYFPAGSQSLFLAHAGECVFKRVSRRAEKVISDGHLPDPDWIQQTRMLYRNRTGAELQRILIPGRDEAPGDMAGVEICAGILPPAWVVSATTRMQPGLLFLHASAARSGDSPDCCRRVEEFERKIRRQRREAGFRAAAWVLLGTWMLSLLGACRGRPDDADRRQPWEEASREWHGMGARRGRGQSYPHSPGGRSRKPGFETVSRWGIHGGAGLGSFSPMDGPPESGEPAGGRRESAV